MPSDSTETQAVNAVAVKLSPFSSKEPVSWFRRAEVQFRLRKITDLRTQADYVLEAIPEDIFPRISAWLDKKDDDVKYEDLKTYLLEEFSLSVSARAQRLLGMPQQPLGDTTAHAAWNEMQALARLPGVDPATNQPRRIDLLRELWLQRLPPSVRAALHDADDSPMEALIKKADELINAAKASRIPDAICSAPSEDPPDTNATRTVTHKRPSIDRVRDRKSGPRGQLLPSGFCSYHYKFGAGARNCLPGCHWPKNM